MRRVSAMRGHAIVGLVVTAALLAACSSDPAPPDGSGATSVSPAADRPTSTATIEIVSPKQGEVIHGSTTELEAKLTGGKIVQQTSTDSSWIRDTSTSSSTTTW